ncbi:HalOD1 output domain-containing protein [Natrarchaeobaculum aegyptiacum]|uniref:Halobacterial output domain-containing protein n=1 Tax=Natrarchaeobaculum aegyptiacum TaxID=745377 RepID=A0A2Z2I2Z2_9EURY|nr:HalOD1 output domain-containing protein [Natrarchaeobaculum aegyptiacum]ARS91478.1 hypothetical protein B1756_18285 [Natrarchaeobaculum aegyptiacum]
MGGKTIVSDHDEWNGSTPSAAVLTAVAELEGDEPGSLPERLGYALYDYVDPEALDTILAHRPGVTVTFALEQYDVEVSSTCLTVCERDS